MATSGTYYLNGPNLSTSTAVYLDAAFTNCAPDGYYSDGTIVRQQVACVLLPEVICPACAAPCGDLISLNGTTGLYNIDVNTTNAIGAIVITFDVSNAPLGILTELGGVLSNGMSSQYYGWLQGTLSSATYIGDAAQDCGIVTYSPITVTEYEYQNGSFQNIGAIAVPVNIGQTVFTATNPGMCKMVIPKPTNYYTILSVQLSALCANTDLNIQVDCPIQLPNWNGGINSSSITGACLTVVSEVYYYVHVNGNSGILGMFDMVFSDPNGEFPLPAGYYSTGAMSPLYDWVQVDSNGVIVALGTCPTLQGYLIQRCYTSTQEVIYVSGTLSIGDRVLVNEYPGCIFEVLNTTTNPQTVTFNSVTSSVCGDQCSSWQLSNSSGSPLIVTYTDCSGGTDYFNLFPGDTPIICAREIVSAPPAVSWSIVNCQCSPQGKYLVQLCGDPSVQFDALSTIAISVGQLVKISRGGYTDCWFEVISSSTSPAYTTVLSSNNGAFTCSSVCNEYTVSNSTGFTQTVNYIDCSGAPVTGLIFNGTSAIICAKAGTVSAGPMTVTLNSCNC